MSAPENPVAALEFTTFDLAHVVKVTGAPSEPWIRKKLNKGLIPGRKAGRHWRMTESDMAALVEHMRTGPARPVADDLTPTSRRRLRRAS